MLRLLPLVGALLLPGCRDAPSPLPSPPGAAQYWVQRTDAELSAVLQTTCAQATAANKPILISFSAPWCGDCRQVRALEHQPAMAAELQRWEEVVVEVGRLDRHVDLLQHFKVSAIARWVAVRPTDCSAPVTAWPVLKSGTLEPQTGMFGPRTEAELVAWLVEARGT